MSADAFTKHGGSPPRVWGKRSRPPSARWRTRFTPTRVGKTGQSEREALEMAVHPHACGENQGVVWVDFVDVGSPPRVWGKRARAVQCHDPFRFTPTRVGKTHFVLLEVFLVPVHPHACGENDSAVHVTDAVRGSPPRVWGKLSLSVIKAGRPRFTPTRVGKTPAVPLSHTIWPVHPHACGENAIGRRMLSFMCGSPPRVWGKLDLPL